MNPSPLMQIANQAAIDIPNQKAMQAAANWPSVVSQYNFPAPQAIPNLFANLDGGLLGAMQQSYGAGRFLNNTSLPINFSAPTSNAQS